MTNFGPHAKNCFISFNFFISFLWRGHPNAKELCDCYTVAHKTFDENEGSIVMDSCEQLLKEILSKLENSLGTKVIYRND